MRRAVGTSMVFVAGVSRLTTWSKDSALCDSRCVCPDTRSQCLGWPTGAGVSVWAGRTVLNKTTAKKSLSLDTMLCRGSSKG